MTPVAGKYVRYRQASRVGNRLPPGFAKDLLREEAP